jgi:hypothetical protein
MNTFTPKTTIESTKLNQNFEGIADGTEISAGAIVARHTEAQEAWITPTLINSWVDYNSGNYGDPGYMIDTLGYVHLKGLVKNGTATANVFVLPAGYRPEKRLIFAGLHYDGQTLGCRIDVTEAGEVVAIGITSNSWLSFDNITFKAYQ